MFFRKTLLISLFLILWWLLVLYPYPNTYKIIQSVYRLFNPPICTESVIHITKEVENMEPLEIERYLLEKISYRHDWENYGYPWYFPSAKEVIERNQGDCKSRFLIIASVFESHRIEYDLIFSVNHIWINYDRKPETAIENMEVAMFSREQGFKVPEIDKKRTYQSFKRAFWDCMPKEKKILFLSGPLFSILLLVSTRRKELE